MRSMCLAASALAAVVACSGRDLMHQAIAADGINPWYKDASGNIDPCKSGIPQPGANLGPDGDRARAMFDLAIEQCHEKRKAAALAHERWLDEEKRRHDEQRAQAEAHRAYLERRHLTAVTVLDLQANGAQMVGGDVAVTGYIKVFGEDAVIIYSSPDDINGVPLNVTHAAAASRRFIFSHCSSMDADCMLEVNGTVTFDGHVGVDVE